MSGLSGQAEVLKSRDPPISSQMTTTAQVHPTIKKSYTCGCHLRRDGGLVWWADVATPTGCEELIATVWATTAVGVWSWELATV